MTFNELMEYAHGNVEVALIRKFDGSHKRAELNDFDLLETLNDMIGNREFDIDDLDGFEEAVEKAGYVKGDE